VAYIAASVFYIIIIFSYFSSLFKIRYSLKATIGICIALAILNLSLVFINDGVVNIIASIVTLAVIISLFSGNVYNRIIFAVFLLIAGVISEFIVAYIMNSSISASPYEMQFGTPVFLFGLMLSRTQFAVLARVIVGLARNRRLPRLKVSHWVLLIAPPIGSLIVLYNFMFLRVPSLVDMISSVIIMTISITVITAYWKILLDYEIELKNKYLEELLNYYKYQYFLAEKSEKLVSKTKHDIKNILIGFQAGIRSQNIDSVENGINRLLGELDSFDGPAVSGNLVIDSIINYKASVAKKYMIYFSMNLSIPSELEIDSVIVSQVLGSALDNAIEAVVKIDSVEDRVIQINITHEHESLFLKISNPYSEDVKTDRSGKLMSAKRNYRSEGIGYQSIISVISENKGEYDVTYSNGQFCLSVTFYNVHESKKTSLQ